MKKKDSNNGKLVFHPITAKLGEEGRKGAVAAAKRILKMLKEDEAKEKENQNNPQDKNS